MPEPTTTTAPSTTPPPAPSAAASLPESTPKETTKALDTTPSTPTQDDMEFDKVWDTLKEKKAPTPPQDDKPKEEPEDAAEKAPESPAKESKKDTPKDAKEGRVIEPKHLRNELERTKWELKKTSEEFSQLKAKVAEYETKAKDTTVMAERLAAREKEVEDLQSTIRALKQEASPEFVEKYDKPFNQAAELAKAEIEQLAIINPETGEVARRADFSKDFASIYGLEYIEAKARAKQMFGEDAGVAMEHYLALKRMDRARQTALAEEKSKWAEKEKAQQAQTAQQREAMQAAEVKVREDLLKRYPEWYAEDPNDPDGNALLKQASEFIGFKPQTFQQAVTWRTRLQLNAMAFPRELARNEKLRAEVAALKSQIEEMKNSRPGKGAKPGGAEAPKQEKGLVEGLAEFMAEG